MNERDSRRAFLAASGAGLVLAACRRDERAQPEPSPNTPRESAGAAPSASGAAYAAADKDEKKGEQGEKGEKGEKGEDVGAVEDLMREHGVIRRVLVAYRETAGRLRTKPAAVPLDALQQAAKLMRSFGEDYHEKQLEEVNIFPSLLKDGGAIGGTVTTLIAQHQRGREITEYILTVTQKAIGAGTAESLARTLEAFARMYEGHAAIEDTLVFPAWKKALGPKQVAEMGERFEDIEHKTFGKDGFDDAVAQIGAIEKALGIDLAALTAPPPR
jgi:hemerythrin-like domain-containing protein